MNKKPVNDYNIERSLRRYDISEEELLSMGSPVDGQHSKTPNVLSMGYEADYAQLASSPAFSIFTPQSIESPPSELQSARLPTPGPNSRMLSIGSVQSQVSNPPDRVQTVRDNEAKSSSDCYGLPSTSHLQKSTESDDMASSQVKTAGALLRARSTCIHIQHQKFRSERRRHFCWTWFCVRNLFSAVSL